MIVSCIGVSDTVTVQWELSIPAFRLAEREVEWRRMRGGFVLYQIRIVTEIEVEEKGNEEETKEGLMY